MNPDIPKTPREELEARLTALLLGELPAEEAFALGRAIEQDAELARLYARLKETISLVKETSATPIRTSAPPLQLSQTRREKLLAQFKTVKPKQFVEAEKPGKSWINALAAAAVVMLLGALAMPNFIKTRTTSQSNAIINNLRQLDGAKQQWALENHKSAIDEPTMNDLEPYLRNNFPSIAGEKYVVGKIGEPVAADLDSSRAKKAFGEHEGTRVISRGGAQRLELAQGEPLAVVPRQLNRPGASQREIVAETPGGAKAAHSS